MAAKNHILIIEDKKGIIRIHAEEVNGNKRIRRFANMKAKRFAERWRGKGYKAQVIRIDCN